MRYAICILLLATPAAAQSKSAQVVDLLNFTRANEGSPALIPDKRLDSVAKARARELVRLDRKGDLQLDWTFNNLLRPQADTDADCAAAGYVAALDAAGRPILLEVAINESVGKVSRWVSSLLVHWREPHDGGELDHAKSWLVFPHWIDVGVGVAGGNGDYGNGQRGHRWKVVVIVAVEQE